MRVPTSTALGRIAADLRASFAALTRQHAFLSSGRRILVPSDDPAGAARALAVRSRQGAAEQFRRNVAESRSRLGSADSVVQSVVETITQAKAAAVQGANDTNDALARQSIGRQVDQLLETAVNLANSRATSGEYLFGGQEATVAPYGVVRDTAGHITAVTPNPRGIDRDAEAEVSDGLTIAIGVSGTSMFGAETAPTFVFDVLIRVRDALNGDRLLTPAPDVDANGATTPTAYLGIDAATDLEVVGPRGSASIGLTTAADDPLSSAKPETSAIATAARINAVSPVTGVVAAVTPTRVTSSSGTLAVDLALDGSPGRKLIINGQTITGAVSGSTPAERRDALVSLINAVTGATGVRAVAVPASDDFALVADDGRNIAVETDGVGGPGSVNAVLFGFATGLTTSGAATTVVARGGVRLTSPGLIATVVAPGSDFAEQVGGEGTTGIQAALDELTTALDRVTASATAVGTRLGWLELLDDRLATDGLDLTSTLSRTEDLDVVQAIQAFNQMQLAYERALASSAKLLQTSLLDFLR